MVFLDRVNVCGANHLMLQTREGQATRDTEVYGKMRGHHAERRVKFATRLTTADVSERLTHYVLEWTHDAMHNYRYHSFRRKHLRKRKAMRHQHDGNLA